MEMSERLVAAAVDAVLDEPVVEWNGLRIDLAAPWERISFHDAIKRFSGVDGISGSPEELLNALPDSAEGGEDLSRSQLLEEIFSTAVERNLVNPTIVFDYPIEMSPLAKPKRGNPDLAERFEVFVGGTELINAFSELNDPIDQWDRFTDQAQARAAGDREAQCLDVDYVRALVYGLPPTGGLGLGVDRLVMLLTGKSTIRDVRLSPIMRDVDD